MTDIRALGDNALCVEFGRVDRADNRDAVAQLETALHDRHIEGLIETVPSFASLMLIFDPDRCPREALIQQVHQALDLQAPSRREKTTRWVVPCSYELPQAEDIEVAAEALGIEASALAQTHQNSEFQLAMYGFAPGYAYLSGCPSALNLPRRQRPRPPTPQNAVLIAGGQSLLGAAPMPTGWYVIGCAVQSPLRLKSTPPVLFEPGDFLRFEAVSAAKWQTLKQAIDRGETVLYQEAR